MSRAKVGGIPSNKMFGNGIWVSDAVPTFGKLGRKTITRHIEVCKKRGGDRFGGKPNFGEPTFHLLSTPYALDDLFEIFIK